MKENLHVSGHEVATKDISGVHSGISRKLMTGSISMPQLALRSITVLNKNMRTKMALLLLHTFVLFNSLSTMFLATFCWL